MHIRTLSKKGRVNTYIIPLNIYGYTYMAHSVPVYSFLLFQYIAPSVSLSVPSSTQLRIMLTAPTGSSSLTYMCTITEIDMPPITVHVNGTELEYTVDGLSSGVNYTVDCMSSNGEDSCETSMDTIISKLTFPYIYTSKLSIAK